MVLDEDTSVFFTVNERLHCSIEKIIPLLDHLDYYMSSDDEVIHLAPRLSLLRSHRVCTPFTLIFTRNLIFNRIVCVLNNCLLTPSPLLEKKKLWLGHRTIRCVYSWPRVMYAK